MNRKKLGSQSGDGDFTYLKEKKLYPLCTCTDNLRTSLGKIEKLRIFLLSESYFLQSVYSEILFFARFPINSSIGPDCDLKIYENIRYPSLTQTVAEICMIFFLFGTSSIPSLLDYRKETHEL